MLRTCSLVFAMTALLGAQGAALKPYRVSPPVSLSQGLGICTLKLDYSRPAVKGRKVWGGLVPDGQVWRLGANGATTITFSHPVKVAGKDIPAGTYALFAIPGPRSWTWILNSEAKQWGSYFYKPEKDVLRWEAAPKAISHQEWMGFQVDPMGDEGWEVELLWEKVAVGFRVNVDARGLYWAHLEETLAQAKPEEWVPWLQAAQYCLATDQHLDRAMGWADTALKAQANYNTHEVKARLLRKAGKTPEALEHLDQAIRLSEGKVPKEYLDNLKRDREAWAK